MSESASGGNEPKVRQAPMAENFGKPKEKGKGKRPTRPACRYTVTADGMVVMTMSDFINAVMSREERDKHEAALTAWYVKNKVCQEPYLPGETLEEYKVRTGSNG